MAEFEYAGGGEDQSGGPRPFDTDGYLGFDPRLPSQRFDESQRFDSSFRATDHYGPSFHDDAKEVGDEYKGTNGFGYHQADGPASYGHGFEDEPAGHHVSAVPPLYAQSFESDLHSDYVPSGDFGPVGGANGQGFAPSDDDENFFSSIPSNGAVLPPPEEMREEGLALREWKRRNAIRLEEKEVKEREMLAQIIDDGDYYKDGLYVKRKNSIESGKKTNREKEKVFLVNQENFHKTADQQYWKAVADLIPNELPTIELKSRGKDKDRKASVVANKGPKPGKATDLTRMRQILVKLKHNPPPHMKPPPPPPPATPKETLTPEAGKPEAAPSNPSPLSPPTPPQAEASPVAASA